VIGTPDDLVKVIKDVYAKSGGFGTVVGFVHDWANIENTMRSWDMVARYVIPEINGYVAKLRESQKFLIENRAVFDRAGQAIMAKIMENKDAVEALKVTESPRFAAANAALPKLLKEKEKEKEEQEKKGKQQAAE
jgi:limonene 1,2-monooxygenase